jgi:hypothetical protein
MFTYVRKVLHKKITNLQRSARGAMVAYNPSKVVVRVRSPACAIKTKKKNLLLVKVLTLSYFRNFELDSKYDVFNHNMIIFATTSDQPDVSTIIFPMHACQSRKHRSGRR